MNKKYNMAQEFAPGLDKAILMECIVTAIERRGKGVEGDPIRVITQVFTKDGKLIAEWDVVESGRPMMPSQYELMPGAK